MLWAAKAGIGCELRQARTRLQRISALFDSDSASLYCLIGSEP